MREALSVIAETRDSERLRQFLSTGQDRMYHTDFDGSPRSLTVFVAGEIIVPTRPDLPRGLNQLGNTCYLNSLLQVRSSLSSISERLTDRYFCSISTRSRSFEMLSHPWQIWTTRLLEKTSSLMKTLISIEWGVGMSLDGRLFAHESVRTLSASS